MILPHSGRYIGKGRLLVHDDVLGIPIECDVNAVSDDAGLTYTGTFTGENIGSSEILVNFQADDGGQFDVTAGYGGIAIEGKGKLASLPGVCLLWTADRSAWATFTLFEVAAGHGLRAIIHDGKGPLGLELAFQGQIRALSGDNVVSLSNRRRR